MTCFDIVAKLASYTNPITPAQANDQDFTQNQQLVLDNKALFMPNGTWIVGEMAEAPRADGFEWGMTALPAVKAGGDGYSYTWFEQAWIPAGAEHQDAAKQFVAYLYSDEACKLFAESGAIQPVLGIADSLEGDNKMFYSIYDNGAKGRHGQLCSLQCHPRRGSAHRVLRPCQLSGVWQHDRAAVDRRHQVRQRPDARQHHRVIKPCPAGGRFLPPPLFWAVQYHQERSAQSPMRTDKSRKRFVFLCVAPATILFFLFMILPTLNVFRMSLYERGAYSPNETFVGLKNFQHLLRDAQFIRSMQNMILLVVTVTLITFAFALVFAAILTREKIKGQNFFRIIFYIPNILSVVVISGIFSAIYKPENGMLNSIIGLFRNMSDPILWKGEKLVIPSIIIAMVWQAIGYYVVMYMASMSAVPISLYESANLDGAGRLTQFFQRRIGCGAELYVQPERRWPVWL